MEARSLVVCHDELKKLVINSLMTFSKEVEVLWSPVLRGDLVSQVNTSLFRQFNIMFVLKSVITFSNHNTFRIQNYFFNFFKMFLKFIHYILDPLVARETTKLRLLLKKSSKNL